MPPDSSSPHGLIRFLACMVIIGIFSYIAWELLHRRSVFLIQLTPEGPEVKHGRLRREFLEQLKDLQKQTGLTHGTIRGELHSKSIRLSFARDFPDDCKQRVLNLWAIYQ